MRKTLTLMSLSLLLLFILSRCAPYKMKAIRAQRDHRYDLSIKFAMKHLTGHPNDLSTVELLNKASQSYFNELQQRIQHFESLNDWDKVVSIAEQAYRRLSDVTKVVGTNFPTKSELDYLQSKKEQSKFKQANEIYSEALKLYQSGDYLEAREKFKGIESYVRHFKDTDQLLATTNQKLASQQYQQARDFVHQGNLEKALDSFEKTAEYVPDFLDVQFQMSQVKGQLAEKYYQEGQNRFNSGDYKEAHNFLKQSLSFYPDNSLAKNLFDETREKLTVRLAVFPFASSKLDQKFGAVVSQQILTRVLPRKSDFVTFLDRDNLQKIFEEQALSQTGAIDEKTAVQVGSMSGVNTIVVGSVTLISDKQTEPTKRTLTGYYDKRYRDVKGVQRSRKEPFNYTAYTVTRDVEVNVSYRLINVETGEILFNESISHPVSDSAEWFTCPSEFVQYLSSSEKGKLKGSKEPKSRETLINQAIEALTNRVASKIISQVSPF